MAIALLGSKCKNCDFRDARALQIDHVNGDGYIDRITNGMWSMKLYRAIVNGIVDIKRYQLLCANCNWIKKYENNEVKDAQKVIINNLVR